MFWNGGSIFISVVREDDVNVIIGEAVNENFA